MSVFTSIYEEMSENHHMLMDSNHEHLENMLDFAISELVEIARDNEICLVDNLYICESYEDIFNCLKHRSEKRMNYKK